MGRSPGRHSGRSALRKALRSSRQTPEGLTPKQKAGYSPWSPEAPEDSAPRNHVPWAPHRRSQQLEVLMFNLEVVTGSLPQGLSSKESA